MINKPEINCPHYEGDGYTYSLADVEFNYCEYCHKRLFRRMVSQYKIEKECDDFVKSRGWDANCTLSEQEKKE